MHSALLGWGIQVDHTMALPKKYKPHEIEARWQGYWEERNLYAWDPERGRDETFVVDTPPPTVSGSLHMGHLFSYSHQDFIVRYQRMRGKNIFFPIGWDDNGLPTERRVQNLFNVRCEPHLPYDPEFKGERGRAGDPAPVSRRNFIELCDEAIKEDEAVYRRLWNRLGLSYDWGQEYATIDAHCRRTSQLSFLELLDDGLIYHAERPVMWDVDFRTAIAQAEVVDKEVPGAFHYLRFKVEDAERDYVVIATTRPELLPACVAVLAHPDDERYKPLFGKNAVTPLFQVPVPILPDRQADPDKGTGIVMVCTYGDQTDVDWVRELGLPVRQILDRDGHLLPVTFETAGAKRAEPLFGSRDPETANETYSLIQGKYIKQAQKLIIEAANAIEGVIDRPPTDISHAVKFFEKGERPLELIPARQWFCRLLDHRQDLIEQGNKIHWRPPHMGIRYQHWVEGLNQDWCLSRQRFFGVPIPVWYALGDDGCPRYDQRILPGRDQLPIDPLSDCPEAYTPAQRDHPGGFTGDPDVLDTWATSSLTPQIATRWAVDKGRHARLFPMDIRPQSHEIIRTWAFYTIVKAYLHEKTIPWKNVVISGWILDPDRKKMSKSRGDTVTPEPLVDQWGSDSCRYWSARARLGVDTVYDEQVFKVGKRLCTKLFNASKFVIGRIADGGPAPLGPDRIVAETDRAVIYELRPLLEQASAALDVFDYAQALMLIEDFFWRTFCDNYLELAKPRTYDDALSEGRLSAASTLRIVHRILLRMFAPYLPYITEEVWHWCYANDADMHESVHRSPWPVIEELAGIPEPTHRETFQAALAVIEPVRKAKAEASLSVKAPVRHVKVTAGSETVKAIQATVKDIGRMLQLQHVDLLEGDAGEGLARVEIGLES